MKPSTLSRIVSVGLVVAAGYLPSITQASPASPPDASLDSCGAPDLPAARAKARRLVRQIRADLTAVEDQIRHARILGAVESETAAADRIAAIAAEVYSIVHSDLNSFHQMAARWDSSTSHFFGDLESGEAQSLPLLLQFAAGIGLPERDLHVRRSRSPDVRPRAG